MTEIMRCNKNGELTFPCDKILCHENGYLHKAFSVFVFDGDKMLLQKRAKEKYHSGGLWSNACCSHFANCENVAQELIKVRFFQELGTSCSNLKHVFDFCYKTKFEDGLIENEFDCVYIAKIDGEINFNKEEISDVVWLNIKNLKKDVKNNPQNYTFWFKKCYKKVIKIYKKILNNFS